MFHIFSNCRIMELCFVMPPPDTTGDIYSESDSDLSDLSPSKNKKSGKRAALTDSEDESDAGSGSDSSEAPAKKKKNIKRKKDAASGSESDQSSE